MSQWLLSQDPRSTARRARGGRRDRRGEGEERARRVRGEGEQRVIRRLGEERGEGRRLGEGQGVSATHKESGHDHRWGRPIY